MGGAGEAQQHDGSHLVTIEEEAEMGFRVPTGTEITLEFGEDFPALQGAYIKARSKPLREINAMDDMTLDALITYLVEQVIIEWDFEDEHGRPLGVTVESVQSMEAWVPFAIRGAWYRAALTPPGPLSERSSNGVQSGAGSTPSPGSR